MTSHYQPHLLVQLLHTRQIQCLDSEGEREETSFISSTGIQPSFIRNTLKSTSSVHTLSIS